MNELCSADPEYRRWQLAAPDLLEGTLRTTHGLGSCPPGWRIESIDRTLYHRGPVVTVDVGWSRKAIRLDRRGYRQCADGRFLLANCRGAETSVRPWRPAVDWLLDLQAGFEISATCWCVRGERDVLDSQNDIFWPLPHPLPWNRFVTSAGWLFMRYFRTEAELAEYAAECSPAPMRTLQ